jgi:hypothetical protein
MLSSGFYLGTHEPSHLWDSPVPLCVSTRRMSQRMTLPRAKAPWVLDSGGFSELSMYGEWRTSPAAYVKAALRYQDEIGRLVWAAPQDWMCEPAIIAKTGRSVSEHIVRTAHSFLSLMDLEPSIPWIPVIQGWHLRHYLDCVNVYDRLGVDLTKHETVGVGSVCRRQATEEIGPIFRQLSALGIRCHGFGVKVKGLRSYADHLVSSDSMAWSYHARRRAPLPGCSHQHCGNCLKYALKWRTELVMPEVVPDAT